MTKNNSKKDPAEIFVKNIKEVSSVFTTNLDSFFEDVKTSMDRIFSNDQDNASSDKKSNK